MRLAVDCELRSFILQRVLSRLLPGAVDDVVSAFDARARAVYGAPRESHDA
jgi:ribosome-associated toxin RatA of RatAB toxin-antitoxin module